MAEFKIFSPKDRVELLEGVVFDMSAIGARHGSCVDRLAHSFFSGVQDRAIVRVQGPVQIGEFSEPQPDVAILRFRSDFYADHHPMPPDIHLVVEVADSSLRHDLARKAPLYVAGGVPEVWVVDLTDSVIHVTTPAGTHTVGPGDSLAPAAFPDIALDVAVILGL
jgi:Uma2 family endonuclease